PRLLARAPVPEGVPRPRPPDPVLPAADDGRAGRLGLHLLHAVPGRRPGQPGADGHLAGYRRDPLAGRSEPREVVGDDRRHLAVDTADGPDPALRPRRPPRGPDEPGAHRRRRGRRGGPAGRGCDRGGGEDLTARAWSTRAGRWLAILLLGGCFGFPLYWTLTMAFKPEDEWNPPGKVFWWPHVWTVSNFTDILGIRGASSVFFTGRSQSALTPIEHSLIAAGFGTLLALAVGIFAA